jgi:DNA invertase Pin-like site-specific DNA recombinase
MPGLTGISDRRVAGEITPAGFGPIEGSPKVGAYYTPKQVAALKKKSHPKRRTRITAKQALRIYRDPRTHEEVARAYGISRPTVSNIKAGKSWAHVTGHKTGAAE